MSVQTTIISILLKWPLMASLNCPECDADIEIPSDSVHGEIVACPDCGQSYELHKSDGVFTLQAAETVGEDWGE